MPKEKNTVHILYSDYYSEQDDYCSGCLSLVEGDEEACPSCGARIDPDCRPKFIASKDFTILLKNKIREE